MMHILKNLWSNLLHIFNGQLQPAYPKKNQTVDKDGNALTAEERAEIQKTFQERKDKYNHLMRVHLLVYIRSR
jgi:hypothetical protein